MGNAKFAWPVLTWESDAPLSDMNPGRAGGECMENIGLARFKSPFAEFYSSHRLSYPWSFYMYYYIYRMVNDDGG